MFDVGLPEMLVLLLVAVFIFGPDKLPDIARQAGKLLRQAKHAVSSARDQVSSELGPEYANLDFNDLNPRSLVQKHLLNDLEDDDTPARPGHRPLEAGEQPPYDVEAT